MLFRSRLWRIRIGSEKAQQAFPFYTTKGPGRIPWVACLNDGFGDDANAVGIIKVYWVDCDSVFNENEILDHIEESGYLPGVVRVLKHFDYDIEIEMSGFPIRRKLRVVLMASYGFPISECKDAMHLFKVIYDGILGIVFVVLYRFEHCSSPFPSTSSTSFSRHPTSRY